MLFTEASDFANLLSLNVGKLDFQGKIDMKAFIHELNEKQIMNVGTLFKIFPPISAFQ